jgi:hypothetical protein
MDTSDYPALSNLRRIHDELATDTRRVEAAVNSQLDAVEQLFFASTAEDWVGVAKATRQLAGLRMEPGNNEVVLRARQVCEELQNATGRPQPPQHLAKLLAACRDMRNRTRH